MALAFVGCDSDAPNADAEFRWGTSGGSSSTSWSSTSIGTSSSQSTTASGDSASDDAGSGTADGAGGCELPIENRSARKHIDRLCFPVEDFWVCECSESLYCYDDASCGWEDQCAFHSARCDIAAYLTEDDCMDACDAHCDGSDKCTSYACSTAEDCA